MNEQIRQLLLDAGGQYSSGNQNDWPSWVLGDAVVTKFAELIVNECIDIANNVHMCRDGRVVAEDIKKHFGIEYYTQEDLDAAHERGVELAKKLRIE